MKFKWCIRDQFGLTQSAVKLQPKTGMQTTDLHLLASTLNSFLFFTLISLDFVKCLKQLLFLGKL